MPRTLGGRHPGFEDVDDSGGDCDQRVIARAFICVCSLVGAAIGFGASIIVGFVLHRVGDGDSVDSGDELAIGWFVLPMMVLVPLMAISFGYGAFRIVRRVWQNP